MQRLGENLTGEDAKPRRQRARGISFPPLRGGPFWGVALVLLVGGFKLPPTEAQDWLTGPAWRAHLAQPIKLAWSGAPLRKGLADLARSQRIAMLLDRRVDPGLPLNLHLDNVPVELALQRLARSQNLDLSWYGPLVYFGPEAAARRLRTLAALREDEVKSLPAARRAPFVRTQPWQWDELAEPRALVQQLADEARVEIAGIEQIPHDLWPAAELPPLSWTERLTLVANEFDLTFRFDDEGRKVALVPVPEVAALERSYAAGRNPQALADRWARQAPEAEIKVAGDKVVVRGRAEDHETLTAAKPRSQTPAGGGTEVYTLAVRNQPLRPVLEELKQRLGLELHVDEDALESAKLSLDRRVTFSVEQATLDELFAAALRPAGLTFRRRNKTLDIFPAPDRGEK
ncbi:MAG TPA: STN domain-containing protein [Pirellulales bacterium]|nr:STN domain-containing protein [Pirellulales bacterium]